MGYVENNMKNWSEERKQRFKKDFNDVLNDKNWCQNHGIDYSNPNIEEAKNLFYNSFIYKKRNKFLEGNFEKDNNKYFQNN